LFSFVFSESKSEIKIKIFRPTPDVLVKEQARKITLGAILESIGNSRLLFKTFSAAAVKLEIRRRSA
jgi:hypothetical protein